MLPFILILNVAVLSDTKCLLTLQTRFSTTHEGLDVWTQNKKISRSIEGATDAPSRCFVMGVGFFVVVVVAVVVVLVLFPSFGDLTRLVRGLFRYLCCTVCLEQSPVRVIDHKDY